MRNHQNGCEGLEAASSAPRSAPLSYYLVLMRFHIYATPTSLSSSEAVASQSSSQSPSLTKMSTKANYQIVRLNATRSQPTTKAKPDERKPPAADFLWINAQEEDPKDRDASREKQAFIRTRHHRLKKESQMRSLKSSMQQQPATSGSPQSETVSDYISDDSGSSRNSQDDRSSTATPPVLCQSLEACISMAFPYLSRPTNQSMSVYLQHCKYFQIFNKIFTRNGSRHIAGYMVLDRVSDQ
jgi:hypothetical protein